MYIQPTSKGVFNSTEKKDCTVRALSNTTGMSYNEAHAIMKSHGRLDGHGAYPEQWGPAYLKAGFQLEAVCGTTQTAVNVAHRMNMLGCKVKRFGGMSLKKFMSAKLKGSYILVNRNHAFAVIDGTLVDQGPVLENTYIAAVFKKR